MKSITLARSIVIDRNTTDLEFLKSRWSTETHKFISSLGRERGGGGRVTGGCGLVDMTVSISKAHANG